ncbi:efflux RND transporter periplasmic adaptor subunit [Fulvimonas sp. R45]|uniref:efflux RND transporter periplasmic adaptor subunit n=1 Tax=Fulvimonas sp. R45 TaxID=3045937 RepID=UPI00265E8205|nr:efflux RND transporter periplasmic adaptor subunit [Fulvimonas sp. R45]MDO1528755.1 efflux RND transporter periplasmic adaptor subunit [Fulvimonas sp. R45]
MNDLLLCRPLLALSLTLACAGALAQHAPAGNPLALDAGAVKEAGIIVDKAATRTLADELKAPGEVEADAYSTVLVSPRVASQVLKRKARLGDVVKAGDPLVELSSVDVAGTQGELIVAEQDWRRIAALGPQAVSARRYNEARVARDQANAKLRAYGLSEGQIRNLLKAGSARADGSYDLLAPSEGRITTDDFLVGERVAAGRTLFTLVQENSVWVEAQMTPAGAARVKPGDRVRVIAHGTELPGAVIQRSHQASERTRTVPVRIEVDNRQDLLHPGELVEAYIAVGGEDESVAVPADAVVLLQNQPTVFVAHGTSPFEAAPVVTGETHGGWTVIKQGLKPGTPYVRKGAFVLKARLLRAQLGEE